MNNPFTQATTQLVALCPHKLFLSLGRLTGNGNPAQRGFPFPKSGQSLQVPWKMLCFHLFPLLKSVWAAGSIPGLTSNQSRVKPTFAPAIHSCSSPVWKNLSHVIVNGLGQERERLKEIKYGAATRKMREGTLANGILWVEKQRKSRANEQW